MIGQDPLNPQKNEDEEQNNNTPTMGMGAQQATTQGGAGPQAAPQAPQAQAGVPQQKGSGSFTNLQTFLKANQNFAKSQGGLGGKMSGRIGGQVGQAQQTLATEKQKFGQTLGNVKQQAEQTRQGMQPSLEFMQSDEGTKFAQQFERDAKGNVIALRKAQPEQQQAATPAMTAEQARENIEKGLNLRYQGPERLGGERELETQKQSLSELGQATGTQEGRFGLLRQFFGRPTYSSGQQRLDQLLVQGSPEQLQRLREARQQTGQFGGQFDKTRQQALQDVAQTRGAVSDIAGQAKADTAAAAQRAEEQLRSDAEARNKLILEREMYGDQGRSAIQAALARAGLDVNDLRLGIDTQKAFGGNFAQAQLAKEAQAGIENLDLERAQRLNTLRQLSGSQDLLAIPQQEAGTGLNVNLSQDLINQINASRGDIDAYSRAAQGAGAFSGEEEKQWRGRMLSNRIDAMFDANNVNPELIRQYAARDPGLTSRVGAKEAARQLLKRAAITSGTTQGFDAEWVQGLVSKEDVVQRIRDNIGSELRRKFGFLGGGY